MLDSFVNLRTDFSFFHSALSQNLAAGCYSTLLNLRLKFSHYPYVVPIIFPHYVRKIIRQSRQNKVHSANCMMLFELTVDQLVG